MDLKTVLRTMAALPSPPPLLIIGESGVGKTQIVRETLADLGWATFELPPLSTLTPEDVLGIPLPRETAFGTVTRFAPPEFWAGIVQAAAEGTRVALFLDELNRSSRAVQNALFPVVAGRPRRAGNIILPEQLWVIAAANPPSYLVEDVCPALLARFTVYMWEPTIQQWLDWAVAHDVHPDILGFLSQNPRMLLLPADTDLAVESARNLRPTPKPRAWAEFASPLLHLAGDDFRRRHQAVAMACGEQAAEAFTAWSEGLRDLPSPEDVLSGRAQMPVHPAQAIVVACRTVDFASSLAAQQEDLEPLVQLFRVAAGWVPELVAGILVRRLSALPGGARSILTVLARVPEFRAAHGEVLRLLTEVRR